MVDPLIRVAARGDLAAEVRRICHDPEANPLAVGAVLDDATDQDWRDWEPAMLRDYAKLKPSQVQLLDKILATQVAVTNPDVFDNWALFMQVNSAFNHRRAHFQWVDKPSVLEAGWTCVCLRRLAGHQFGPGVLRFLAGLCVHDGVLFFPWSGGAGISLCEEPARTWVKGTFDCEAHAGLTARLRKIWDTGDLSSVEPDTVDESDLFEVQMAHLVAVETYIRHQKPESYRNKE